MATIGTTTRWHRAVRRLLAVCGVLCCVLFAASAQAQLIPDIAVPDSTDEAEDCRCREPRPGPNLWVDFAPSGAGRIHRLFAEKSAWTLAGERVEINRYATMLTFGFDYVKGPFSLTVTDSFFDAGPVHVPGASVPPMQSYGFFTNPRVRASIRPVPRFRIDVDVSYLFGFDLQAVEEDGWFHHELTGGVHLVFEAWPRYVGTSPRVEVAVGFLGAWSLATFDPNDGPGATVAPLARATTDLAAAAGTAADWAVLPHKTREVRASALFFGGRVQAVFPVGEEVGVVVGLAAYLGLDPNDLSDITSPDRNLSLEWTAGIRWYPLGT